MAHSIPAGKCDNYTLMLPSVLDLSVGCILNRNKEYPSYLTQCVTQS